MKRNFPYLIILALAVLPVSSCKKSARDVYAEAVEEWTGREILFPDSMMTVSGEFFRTVSILFENQKPDIQFELSGVITNQ